MRDKNKGEVCKEGEEGAPQKKKNKTHHEVKRGK